jgi:hypothetical protein
MGGVPPSGMPTFFVGIYAACWSVPANGRIHRDKGRRDPATRHATRVSWSQRVALVMALIGSLVLSYYSVKYWHIALSDLVSI